MASSSTVRGGAAPNWFLGVSQGGIPGTSFVAKFGRNPSIGSGETEDIWGAGGTWVAPTQARTHSITGDAADVNTSGTGAWTVEVQGLNGSYAETTETVNMAGAGGVNTSNSYVIIYRLIVLTAGTGGTNAGVIAATAATDSTVTCSILAGVGQSQMAIYQIAAGYTAYMMGFNGSMNGGNNANVLLNLFAKPFGGVFNLKSSISLNAAGSSFGTRLFAVPLTFAAKTTIKLRATSDAVGSDVTGEFDLILVAD